VAIVEEVVHRVIIHIVIIIIIIIIFFFNIKNGNGLYIPKKILKKLLTETAEEVKLQILIIVIIMACDVIKSGK
jgi:hypothetical protein